MARYHHSPKQEIATLCSELRNRTVLIGYSGGCDSTVLLHCLLSLKDRYNLCVQALYVSHDVEADKTSGRIATLKKEHPYLSISALRPEDIITSQKNYGREAAWREARYASFYAYMKNKGIQDLILAHHEDDQAETFLLALLQGNLFSAKGMSRFREQGAFRIWRPLLSCRQQDLKDFAVKKKLYYWEDPSNTDENIRRNFLRHSLMPLASKSFPKLSSRLSVLAKQVKDIELVLSEKVLPPWGYVESTSHNTPSEIHVRMSEFCALPATLRLLCLHKGLSLLTPKPYPRLSARFFAPLLSSHVFPKKTILEGAGYRFFISDDFLHWQVVDLWEKKGYFYCVENSYKELKNSLPGSFIGSLTIPVRGYPCVLRSPRCGDTLWKNEKKMKLRDFLSAHPLTSKQKDMVPIVEDKEGIAAILLDVFHLPSLFLRHSHRNMKTITLLVR